MARTVLSAQARGLPSTAQPTERRYERVLYFNSCTKFNWVQKKSPIWYYTIHQGETFFFLLLFLVSFSFIWNQKNLQELQHSHFFKCSLASVACFYMLVVLKHVSDQGPDRRNDFLIRSRHYLWIPFTYIRVPTTSHPGSEKQPEPACGDRVVYDNLLQFQVLRVEPCRSYSLVILTTFPLGLWGDAYIEGATVCGFSLGNADKMLMDLA